MREFTITIHAVAATIAFVLGTWMLIRVRAGNDPGRPPLHLGYLGSLFLMALAVFAAVGLDWPTLRSGARAGFIALCLLAVAMVHQADRARRIARSSSSEARVAFVDRVGFTLVALFVGFAVVTSLDAGAPVWLIVLVGVLSVFGGRRAVAAARPQHFDQPRSGDQRSELDEPGRHSNPRARVHSSRRG